MCREDILRPHGTLADTAARDSNPGEEETSAKVKREAELKLTAVKLLVSVWPVLKCPPMNHSNTMYHGATHVEHRLPLVYALEPWRVSRSGVDERKFRGTIDSRRYNQTSTVEKSVRFCVLLCDPRCKQCFHRAELRNINFFRMTTKNGVLH